MYHNLDIEVLGKNGRRVMCVFNLRVHEGKLFLAPFPLRIPDGVTKVLLSVDSDDEEEVVGFNCTCGTEVDPDCALHGERGIRETNKLLEKHDDRSLPQE